MPSAEERATLLERFSVTREQFVLATIHRPENVDTPETLDVVLRALAGLDMPVLFPMHPRTRQRVEAFGLRGLAEELIVVEPIGYRDFIGLGAESLLIVSDSGGIQEEVSVYKRPAVVIRRSTERQEVEGTFVRRFEPGPDLSSQLGAEIEAAPQRSSELAELPSPYGDNHAPEMCVAAIRSLVGATGHDLAQATIVSRRERRVRDTCDSRWCAPGVPSRLARGPHIGVRIPRSRHRVF